MRGTGYESISLDEQHVVALELERRASRRAIGAALDPECDGVPAGAEVPGVIPPGQPGGPSIDNCHQIPCKFNGKWVGTLCNREAKGTRRPP